MAISTTKINKKQGKVLKKRIKIHTQTKQQKNNSHTNQKI